MFALPGFVKKNWKKVHVDHGASSEYLTANLFFMATIAASKTLLFLFVMTFLLVGRCGADDRKDLLSTIFSLPLGYPLRQRDLAGVGSVRQIPFFLRVQCHSLFILIVRCPLVFRPGKFPAVSVLINFDDMTCRVLWANVVYRSLQF
jgi:hypothetical protein